jgi:hypothetical protein
MPVPSTPDALLAGLLGVAVVVLIVALVFLLIREINCWYWKINAALDILREQRNSLQRIEQSMQGVARLAASPPPLRPPGSQLSH